MESIGFTRKELPPSEYELAWERKQKSKWKRWFWIVAVIGLVLINQGSAKIDRQQKQIEQLNDRVQKVEQENWKLNDQIEYYRICSLREIECDFEKTQVDQSVRDSLKGTPMEPLADLIAERSEAAGVNWSLVVGIAYAESGLGKSYVVEYDRHCWNFWGIRKVRNDGSYLQCYYGPENGVQTIVNTLVRQYYCYGLKTPEQMARKYLGHNNTANWIRNVRKFYDEQYEASGDRAQAVVSSVRDCQARVHSE